MTKRMFSWLAIPGVLAFLFFIAFMPSSASAGVCMQSAYKQCISNIVYWYDSCGAIQSVAQNCNIINQLCQNAQCVNKPGTGTNICAQDAKLCPDGSYVSRTGPNCTFAACPGTGNTGGNGGTGSTSNIQHYRTQCYNNSIYWYSSQGTANDIYKSCSDNNSCTQDTCSNLTCGNALKCDGSTCATNSADYAKYCGAGGNPPPGQDNGQGQVSGSTIAVAVFGKKTSDPMQWEKSVDANVNDKLEFLITVKNTSPNPSANITVITNITNAINYTGNLKIDDITEAGNINSGIDIGVLGPNSSKAITFSGTVQSGNVQPMQVTAMANSQGASDTDFFTLSTNGGQSNNAAAVVSSTFVEFIKKWYLWGIIILVLVILFIIIFRRLSTNV